MLLCQVARAACFPVWPRAVDPPPPTGPRAPHPHGLHGAEPQPPAMPLRCPWVSGLPTTPRPAVLRRPRAGSADPVPTPARPRNPLEAPQCSQGQAPGPVLGQPLPCPSGSPARQPLGTAGALRFQISARPSLWEAPWPWTGTSPPFLCSPPRSAGSVSGGSWRKLRAEPGRKARQSIGSHRPGRTGRSQGTHRARGSASSRPWSLALKDPRAEGPTPGGHSARGFPQPPRPRGHGTQLLLRP